MSPRELYREMEAANVRRHDEAQIRIHQAWQTAKYVADALVGKLAPLPNEVSQGPAPQAALGPAQTKEQMKTMVRMLAAQHGQPIRRTH